MIKQLNKDLVLIQNNQMANNTYLLIKNKECVVIDPSFSEQEISLYLQKHSLNLVGILLTHGHFDHTATCNELSTKHNVFVYCYEKEKEVLQDKNAKDFWKINKFIVKNVKYYDTNNLKIKDFNFKIIPTPGHTIGSVCIQYKNYLFTGDTLFTDSVGRMDLPTGNARQLIMSLRLLKEMDESLMICPGHNNTYISLKDVKKINTLLNFK